MDPLVPTEPDGPLFKKIYNPAILEGTPIGNTMIEADYLMKQLNLGVGETNKPFKYPKSLVDVGLDFDTLVKKFPKKNNDMERARLWIVIEDAEIEEDPNGVVQVSNVKIGLRAKMQEVGPDGTLKDGDGEVTRHNQEFVALFTKNYDILEKEYPVFK